MYTLSCLLPPPHTFFGTQWHPPPPPPPPPYNKLLTLPSRPQYYYVRVRSMSSKRKLSGAECRTSKRQCELGRAGGAYSAPLYPLAGRDRCPLPHPPRGGAAHRRFSPSSWPPFSVEMLRAPMQCNCMHAWVIWHMTHINEVNLKY